MSPPTSPQGFNPSCQDITNGSAEQKRFEMISILLYLWPDNLVSQLKLLSNAVESGSKKDVVHLGNTELVSANKCLVLLVYFLAASICGTNKLLNKRNMIGSVGWSKHMKK